MSLSEDEVERLASILSKLDECLVKMNPSSRSFVTSLKEKYEQYGAEVRVSPKQWKWLFDLEDRFG